ncbi:transposase [Vibrio tapetis subsp. quintayensis]|uniref:transposase n=1 Tax=Vibrio tapetis TaxID=52443 RepID=UPI0025B3DBD3|nr:transposase [Vibrio tapetis]MDN3678757.1 transposase [Vibrio tapetis subsp. quintayensis]
MATARKQLISVNATPYYHCVSRCVRQSYLCGQDTNTSKSYEHRREWIEHKIQSLSHAYCIDVCAYAVMSNHYHVVLHINRDKALGLSLDDVVQRWGYEHKLPILIQRWLSKELRTEAEEDKCLEIIEIWRERLWSLSWFMKELNYDIACKANQEDQCSGHFWESRFKSQALLDEKALAAAMAYVDLNPVRAGIAASPEQADFTSIKVRLKALTDNLETAPCLYPFIGNSTKKLIDGIPFRLLDYIELVDWTARQYRDGKAVMASNLPPILEKLNFNQSSWLEVCTTLEKKRSTAIGSPSSLEQAKTALDKSRIHYYALE